MPLSVLLVTDRPQFESTCALELSQLGVAATAVSPDAFWTAVGGSEAVLFDAGCDAFDEDELLTSVGLSRALRVLTAVALPSADAMADIEEVLEDLCPGLVARTPSELGRVAGALARRCDPDRLQRFEYVSVSPRPDELVVVLGDGTAMAVARPVSQADDGTEVISIELAQDATTATLTLGSGKTAALTARDMAVQAQRRGAGPGRPAGVEEEGLAPLAGISLGTRLRRLRKAAGLTQAELARRTGIHRPNIARVEAGRHTPSLETLARLASAIGVTASRVLGEEK